MQSVSVSEKCPYLEFFWPVFSRIRTEYGPEKLQIRKLLTQLKSIWKILFLLCKTYNNAAIYNPKYENERDENTTIKLLTDSI